MKAERVIDLLKLLPTLEANLKIAQMRVDIIHTALANLTEREKTIIEQMIIDKENASDCGITIYAERSTVYRIRERALQKLEVALFGKPIENQLELKVVNE